MTDELKSYGEGAYITHFLSDGPKFYAFRALVPSSGKTVECCKVKEISLSTANSRKINFDSIGNKNYHHGSSGASENVWLERSY